MDINPEDKENLYTLDLDGSKVTGYWYKENPEDQVWWLYIPDNVGTIVFSFDRKKAFFLYRDYEKMTKEEKAVFDRENPYWAQFFGPAEP